LEIIQIQEQNQWELKDKKVHSFQNHEECLITINVNYLDNGNN
jgi:hypothetical protein